MNPLTNLADQWMDVYRVLDTRLEHLQRASAIPDGESICRIPNLSYL